MGTFPPLSTAIGRVRGRDGQRVFWQTFIVSSTEAESRMVPAGEPPRGADSAITPSADPGDGAAAPAPREIGGRAGPDPTRFGDWELRGRCIDF
ncbi:MAG TPA: DUF1674 domain-containing protein [Steroidobacteraceae bacterium]|jgi:hypothetical protein|nr:DUF1674 domain-containing protein [Steroidobacteraceae bacterium]